MTTNKHIDSFNTVITSVQSARRTFLGNSRFTIVFCGGRLLTTRANSSIALERTRVESLIGQNVMITTDGRHLLDVTSF